MVAQSLARSIAYRWTSVALSAVLVCSLVECSTAQQSNAVAKKIVFIAGTPSHGYGAHEHFAGCRLLAQSIQQRGFKVECTVLQNGWPADEAILDAADAIVIYADGGGGHPAIGHFDKMQTLMDRGVGLTCLHYAVEIPDDKGGPEFLEWLGGYFSLNYSVNPHWTASFDSFPDHPIAQGVAAFSSNDEWYFHMRFNKDASALTPILSAVAPESTMARADGPHSGNPDVRASVAKGEPQHLAWAFNRANGGRSFGFTGGHFQWNWSKQPYRQLVGNAIAWTAGLDPASAKAAPEQIPVNELMENQDEAKPANFKLESVEKELQLPDLGVSKTENAIKSKLVAAGANSKSIKPAYRSPVITTSTSRHQVDITVETHGAKKIYLVATDGGNGFSCDWADWLNPIFVKQDGTNIKVNDLEWIKAESGYGRVGRNRNCNGDVLKIRSTTFTDGMGTHANSVIEYNVPADVVRFEAIGGLDLGGTSQGGGTQSSVQFLIYLDKVPSQLFDSPNSNVAQRESENAVDGLEVSDGLQIELSASEPVIRSLTNIDIDHRGRVWACEVVNYRKHKNDRPEGDRILILEDTNQDGVMDTSKVFYQGRDVDSPLGICVLGNRILVSVSPNVIEFRDEDGDDIPDSKKAVFTNTGIPQHDHSVHSFVIGPDNRLYFNFGNEGHGLSDGNGLPIKDKWGNTINDAGKPYRQGMAFRCNQDFSDMEVLGNNFRNNYELAVDSFGTIWQSDNDDDGNRGTRINYVMEYGNYGYTDEMTGDSWQKYRTNMEAEIPSRHWHLNDPGVVPTMLLTGAGSPTGITIYEGDLLPKSYRNQIIHCDAGPNAVRYYPVTDDGAGYSATSKVIVEGERDKWFRPADVCVAPDGSMFISDWYDPGVGGHNMEDTQRGRLFRLAPADTPYTIPSFDLSTATGAVAALHNPNNSVRFLAMQAIDKFGASAEDELVKMLAEDSPRNSARALWMLVRNLSLAQKYVSQTCQSANSDLRITAIRAGRMAGLDYSTFVDPMLHDSNSQVRRELLIALREDASDEMPKRWVELANQFDGQDRWMLEAIGIAATSRWNECMAEYLQGHQIDAANDAIVSIIWRSRAEQSAGLIAKLLESPNLDAKWIDPLLRAFDFQSKDNTQQALHSLVNLAEKTNDKKSLQNRIITEAMLRLNDRDKLMQKSDIAAVVKNYVSSLGSDPQQLRIIDRLNVRDINEHLLSMALVSGASTNGVKAIDLILSDAGEKMVRDVTLVNDDENDTQKRAAASGFARILSLSDRGDAAAILKDAVSSPGIDTSVRLIAATGLARTKSGQQFLIGLARAGTLPLDATTMISSTLRDSNDGTVAAEAKRLFPSTQNAGLALPPIDQLIARRGDAGQGKKLFGSVATCSQCHIVVGVGKNVGPDLSEIGNKLTREAMYVSILSPSAGISHSFDTYAALTNDGAVVTGLMVSKNDIEVIIKDKDAIERKLSLDDVEVLKRLEVSLMPANLEVLTGEQGLVDVVEYLMTLKKPE